MILREDAEDMLNSARRKFQIPDGLRKTLTRLGMKGVDLEIHRRKKVRRDINLKNREKAAYAAMFLL